MDTATKIALLIAAYGAILSTYLGHLEWRRRRPRIKMVVVPHEHERMDPPSIGLDRPPQPVKPLFAVCIIQDDVLPCVPARHDMVEFHLQPTPNRPLIPEAPEFISGESHLRPTASAATPV